MEKNNVNILWLGDLHLGIPHTPRLYDELMNIVPKTIEEEEVDMVVVVGDYFDKELVGSHKYYATKFFGELASLCDEKGIVLRMVKGTKSHDENQLTGFFANTNTLLPNLDFKIVNTVEEERVLGLDVLYIPEEEVKNQIEYYEDYKVKTYDVIAGHGNWDFVPAVGTFLMGNNDLEKTASPVHLYDDWLKTIGQGFVVFGHIHNGPSKGNKVFYTGSFSRWKFGEEEDKGFLVSTTNLETKEYSVKFIKNEMAPSYETSTFEEVIGSGGLKDQSLFDVRRKLKEMAGTDLDSKIRINVSDLTPNEITLLQKAAKTLTNVNLVIESKKMKEVLLEEAEQNEKHDYVIHPEKYGLTHEDVIIRYALEENEKIISMSDLDSVLETERV